MASYSELFHDFKLNAVAGNMLIENSQHNFIKAECAHFEFELERSSVAVHRCLKAMIVIRIQLPVSPV